MQIRQVIPDWLKGIGIVLMVYGHIIHIGSFVNLQLQVITPIIYTFHMPLFLIVSGFFFKIEHEPDRVGKNLLSRLVKPYLIFGSVYIAGIVLIQKIGVHTTTIPPASFLDFLGIMLFHPRGPYWFVHSLIVIKLCFTLAKFIAVKTKLDESITIIIYLFLLAISCHYNLLIPSTVLYFCLGIVLNRFGGLLPESQSIGLLLMIIILMVAKDEISSFSIIQVAWCLSIIAFLSGVGRSIEASMVFSILAWMGRNSLVVLVIHPIFTVVLKSTSNLFLILDPTGLAYSAIVLTVTMLGSILTASLFDRFQVSTYLFGVKKIYSGFSNSST